MSAPPDIPSAYQTSIEEVTTVISQMTDVGNTFKTITLDAINSLAAWRPYPEGTPPTMTLTPIEARDLPTLERPDPDFLGEVGTLDEPTLDDLTGLVNSFDLDDPGPFTPHSGLPNIPPPPSPIDTSGQPTRPNIADIVLPPDPDLALPAMDALDEINLPPSQTITIPPFDVDDAPKFEDDAPLLRFNWTEQTYTPLVLNELTATIRSMLAGGFAMPQVVQDALFAAAREREDMTARKATEEAVDEWAGRNFDMPPGMLVEQVNAIRDANQLAVNTLSRDVYTKGAEWAIENLRTAVAQGIAMETMWTQHWNNIAQRAFDAAKIIVETTKDQFNLVVLAFNTKNERIRVMREIFEARLRAELAKLDIEKAEIEREQLKGTINEQRVRVFLARMDGVKTLASIFAEKLNAAKIRADNERSKIELYKGDIEAWAERLRADKTRFDAYEAQVRGEEGRARSYEAEARAYAATVEGASGRNQARLGVVNAKLRAVEVAVTKFLGLLQGSLGEISARRDAIGARASAYTAQTGFFSEQLRYLSTGEELRVRALESTARNNIAFYDAISRQFDSSMQRLLQQGVAIKDAILGAGQMAAQMAAGAFSAIHTSAGISGTGSVSSSFTTDLTPRT